MVPFEYTQVPVNVGLSMMYRCSPLDVAAATASGAPSFQRTDATHMDAVVERHTAVIDVPPLVVRVGEAVDAARKQLQAEKRKRVERPLTDGA